MAEKREQRELSGVLFKEHDKKNERGPDYTGSATIAGTAYRIAAWIKTGAKGGKFMSLAFSIPQSRDEPAPTTTAEDEDVPF